MSVGCPFFCCLLVVVAVFHPGRAQGVRTLSAGMVGKHLQARFACVSAGSLTIIHSPHNECALPTVPPWANGVTKWCAGGVLLQLLTGMRHVLPFTGQFSGLKLEVVVLFVLFRNYAVLGRDV